MERHLSDRKRIWSGASAALVAVSIWAGWIVFTRAAVAPSPAELAPTAWDLAVLRFAAPAILLAPFWFDRRLGLTKSLFPPGLNLWTLIGLQLWGAPFVVLGASGLALGDAALFAALTPGSMPIWAALIAFVALGARPGAKAAVGLAALAIGVATAFVARDVGGATPALAAALMLGAAACWGAFTVAFAASGLSPARAAGLVGAQATLIAGAGALFFGSNLSALPAADLTWHAATQGLLTGVAAILAYAAAIRLLGRRPASAAAALVPPLAAAMAWASLGETSEAATWLGLGCATLGVALVATDRRTTRPGS